MDTEELARRLAAFDAAVSDGPYPAPQVGEWSAEMVLAHAATVNRLVALSVASAIEGEPVPYSNRGAGNEALLRALAAESGGLPELKAEVVRTARVLIRLAAELGTHADAPIPAWIAEGDVVHVDGPVPALALIASTLGYHLGLHREQLATLGAPGGVPTPAPATTPSSPVAA